MPAATHRHLKAAPSVPETSEATRAWQQQLARVERLQQQLADLQALEEAQRQARTQTLQPLQARRQALSHALAHGLVRWLDDKALSERHRQGVRERLCAMTFAMADAGDTAMRALHDQHSPRSWADKRQDAAHELRLRLEARLGECLDFGDEPVTPEAVWRVGWERLQEAGQAQRERRQARRQAKEQARDKAPAAGEPTPSAEADQTLRTLYRQLASAWHPDREPDAAERQRKTALMGEVNTAYGRGDVLTLMRLQGQMLFTEDGGVQATRRLQSMTVLLKRQVADLERQRAARQAELALLFDLPAGQTAQPQTLQADLHAKCQALQTELADLDRDLACLDDVPRLRRWLNAPWQA